MTTGRGGMKCAADWQRRERSAAVFKSDHVARTENFEQTQRRASGPSQASLPPLKIIATSAHFTIHGSELPEGGVFLPKPYTTDSVTTALRVMMGGQEPTGYGR
jgi:hypothetical protein